MDCIPSVPVYQKGVCTTIARSWRVIGKTLPLREVKPGALQRELFGCCRDYFFAIIELIWNAAILGNLN